MPTPYLGEAVEPLPNPNIREAVEPLPIPNNSHQRHLSWGRTYLNSFFSFIPPFKPNGYITYGSRVIHITYTAEGTDPLPRGSRRTEPDLQRHPYTMKLKNKFSFGPSQDTPLLLMELFVECLSCNVAEMTASSPFM